MRIGLIIYGPLDTLSGGYLYDRMLVRHLRSRGDEVTVFSMARRPYAGSLLDNLSRGWFRRLGRLGLDVLLQDELNHPSLFLLNRRLRPPLPHPMVSVVHHLRSDESRPRVIRLFSRVIERWYLASVDAFVFNTQATRRAVERLLGRAAAGIIAHPGGNRLGPPIDAEAIAARVRRSGPLQLIFVGHLISRKGLDRVLTALGRISSSAWKLMVVGSMETDRAYAARLLKRIRTLGLEGKVHLMGPRSDPELASLLQESDVVAMPFAFEGFGIVYLEGMAYGLPAMASRLGGAGELIAHGENGYLFEPGETSRFAELVHCLSQDREELLRLSLAARRRFGEWPTWDETGARIRNFLEKVRQDPCLKGKRS